MIKVSVLYPNGKGKKFDMDYYCNKHIPMVQEKLGQACKRVAVEEGIDSAEFPAVYMAMGHLYFDTIEEFQAGFAQHSESFRQDIPNYTDIQPIIQVTKVKI